MCNLAFRRFAGLACGAVWIALGITGCGGATTVVAPSGMVSGKVTVDGQPAVAVRVRFIPTGETKGFGGFAVSDQRGDYMIESQGGASGLPEGKYKVLVETFRPPEDPTLAAKFAVPGGTPSKVPSLYANEAQSPLTAIVRQNGQPIDLELKSK